MLGPHYVQKLRIRYNAVIRSEQIFIKSKQSENINTACNKT